MKLWNNQIHIERIIGYISHFYYQSHEKKNRISRIIGKKSQYGPYDLDVQFQVGYAVQVTGFWLRYRESIDSYKLLEYLEVDPNDSDLVKAFHANSRTLKHRA